MKKKIYKILGVALTFTLLASLCAFAAPTAAAAPPTNEWAKFGYPKAGADGDWFRQGVDDILAVGPMAEAIDGTLYVYAWVDSATTGTVGTFDAGEGDIYKSTDGGRSWEVTDYEDVDVFTATTPIDPPVAVVDMACSSIDADILYVTDGDYVYKTDDAGDTFAILAEESLETMIKGTCGPGERITGGTTITCLDVGYDADDNPFVFIGVTTTAATAPSAGEPSVLYINEEGYPAAWVDLQLHCYRGPHVITTSVGYIPHSIGCAPDFADSKKVYAVVTTDDDNANGTPDEANDNQTHVVSSTGTSCSWTEVAELLWNCAAPNHFEISAASRIAFPDDYEDTDTLFVGVVDTYTCGTTVTDRGGDVYSVTKPSALDLNVEGFVTGCVGEKAADIISLDIMGDTDEALLIAGAYCDTTVYYSSDGGWTWDDSAKDPTGDGTTYALWVGDSALAATSGCECAVSMSCGEEVGEYWNQISLIATDIDWVHWADFSPGYLSAASETMFMLTVCGTCCGTVTYSLFRHDGEYWDRVFSSTTYGPIDMVAVSPDFNDTDTLYVGNLGFDMWRSTDAGCSWRMLSFPCAPKPAISFAIVLDEETGIAGGNGVVYKTTRHGTRPWEDYKYETTPSGWVKSFAADGDNILLGDDQSQVFISEDAGETWDLVGAALDTAPSTTEEVSVAFDPDYADNTTIYASAGNDIFRCVIDPDLAWSKQDWDVIYTDATADFWGMSTVGDTALYVGDRTAGGGMVRSLNPTESKASRVVFERVITELPTTAEISGLPATFGENGCPDSNVLWGYDDASKPDLYFYEDTLATPVILVAPADGAKLGTTAKATLEWEALCDASSYELELYRYCAECPEEKEPVDLPYTCYDCEEICTGCSGETCCEVVSDIAALEPGVKYYWRVRVCKGDPLLSKWSDLNEFTTALGAVPYLCSPWCGQESVIITTNFSWDAVAGATSYEVEIATNEGFDPLVASGKPTVNAWVTDAPLEYSTTYYWRVRAAKDGVYSTGWEVCIFTTEAEPVAPPEPVPPVEIPPQPAPISPAWIWAVVIIGAVLVIAVIVLIVTTRRVP